MPGAGTGTRVRLRDRQADCYLPPSRAAGCLGQERKGGLHVITCPLEAADRLTNLYAKY